LKTKGFRANLDVLLPVGDRVHGGGDKRVPPRGCHIGSRGGVA